MQFSDFCLKSFVLLFQLLNCITIYEYDIAQQVFGRYLMYWKIFDLSKKETIGILAVFCCSGLGIWRIFIRICSVVFLCCLPVGQCKLIQKFSLFPLLEERILIRFCRIRIATKDLTDAFSKNPVFYGGHGECV